jgi:hypothetical protein
MLLRNRCSISARRQPKRQSTRWRAADQEACSRSSLPIAPVCGRPCRPVPPRDCPIDSPVVLASPSPGRHSP